VCPNCRRARRELLGTIAPLELALAVRSGSSVARSDVEEEEGRSKKNKDEEGGLEPFFKPRDPHLAGGEKPFKLKHNKTAITKPHRRKITFPPMKSRTHTNYCFLKSMLPAKRS
jgi:hypothetical protein